MIRLEVNGQYFHIFIVSGEASPGSQFKSQIQKIEHWEKSIKKEKFGNDFFEKKNIDFNLTGPLKEMLQGFSID